MDTYLYDGTFEGLICCFYQLHKNKIKECLIVDNNNYSESFFEKTTEIRTQENIYEKYYGWLENRFAVDTLRNIYLVYLSGVKSFENLLWKYLCFGLKVGKNIDQYLTQDSVLQVNDLSRKVGFEAHKMLGLVRFKELSDGILYSRIETDFFILPLLVNHFKNRLRLEKWIIHDAKRYKAIVYNKNSWQITDIQQNQELSYSENELKNQDLWRLYFKQIAIENRKNKKLQAQFMPRRYWKNLVETEKP